MGQSNTKVDGKSIHFLGEGASYYFGKVKFYKAIERDTTIVAAQANNHKIDVLQHVSLKHQNLVDTITYDSDFQEVWYTQYGMTFYFEYLQVPLYDICQRRGQEKQRFTLNELNRLMVDMLQVLKYFEQTKTVAHWGLSTNSIFYDKRDKKMKVYNHEMLFGRMYSYFKVLLGQKAYVNPEIQHVISKGVIRPEIDPETKKMIPIQKQPLVATQYGENYMIKWRNRSDIYDLGLTLLEVATYLSSYSLYNSQTNKINIDEIQKRLNSVEQYYNRETAICIASMLNKDPESRPTAHTMLDYLQKNQRPAQQTSQRITRPRQMSVTQSRLNSASRIIPNQSRVRTRSMSQIQIPNGSRIKLRDNNLQKTRLLSTMSMSNIRRSISPEPRLIPRISATSKLDSSAKLRNLDSKLTSILSRSKNVTSVIQ